MELLATRTLRDYVRLDGLHEQQWRMAKRARLEREIFATNSAFVGRTRWDQSHAQRLNAEARYYHCDELIRQPFFDIHWDASKIIPHSIFASSASYPLKGFHVLVRAVEILRNEFPGITLRTPLADFYPKLSGTKRLWKNFRLGGYSRYVTNLIRDAGLENNVFSLPSLDAQEMADELAKAHVFVLPSFIENSPNSLAEAMLVGTPAVASFVGGIPSMVEDGKSALLFPPGDESVLASGIRRIFLDNQLAQALSNQARTDSRQRHSEGKIIQTLLEIYRQESAML